LDTSGTVPTAAAGALGPVTAADQYGAEGTVPQNPYLSPNGDSNAHNDSWMTDTYHRAGPTPSSQSRFRPTSGLCLAPAFDRHGRILVQCVDPERGTELRLLDPHTLRTMATLPMPSSETPGAGLPTYGSGYFYLDQQGRAVTSTADGRIWLVAVEDDGDRPRFSVVREYDLSDVLPTDEQVLAVLPDWEGRIWFAGRHHGTVGFVDPVSGRATATTLNEHVENSLAADREGVYLVSDAAAYRFSANRSGPVIDWRMPYQNTGVRKPGQISAGSGTTPSIMPGGYVAITDNADPINVVVYRTGKDLSDQPRKVCQQPVFKPGASATENSLVAVGRSLVVENNYGYRVATPGTQAPSAPGIARVDLRKDGTGCDIRWISDERVPSVVSKLSISNGILYTYTRETSREGQDRWYWTAVDFTTGRTRWKRLAGVGSAFDNCYSALAIGPEGTAYLGTAGGILSLK
jgi:hypothetical protein